MPTATPRQVTYVLPIKVAERADGTDLTGYLRWLATRADVVVVDGSRADVFDAHARAWGNVVAHLPVASRTRNGKVAGVLDGVAAAVTPYVVIADDDVRYDEQSLAAVVGRLRTCTAVIPQNYFEPTPWHARWDTARSLVNRAFSTDYAGTLGVRRDALVATEGYCGAVLFENLELLRTLTSRGFDVCSAADIFVRRHPPTARHFVGQRVRQAYDSRSQPARLVAELLVVPTLLAALTWRRSAAAAILTSTVAVAETGRRRGSGREVFAWDSALWAPVWLLERGVASWLAMLAALRGGVRYGDGRLRTAAHSRRELAGLGCPERSCACVTPWRSRTERSDAS